MRKKLVVTTKKQSKSTLYWKVWFFSSKKYFQANWSILNTHYKLDKNIFTKKKPISIASPSKQLINWIQHYNRNLWFSDIFPSQSPRSSESSHLRIKTTPDLESWCNFWMPFHYSGKMLNNHTKDQHEEEKNLAPC